MSFQKQAGKMTPRERLERHLPIFFLAALATGFVAGYSTFRTIQNDAQLEVMPRGEKAQLIQENARLKQENDDLKQKLRFNPDQGIEITINHPQAEQSVDPQETVTGEWKNIPNQHQIWVVVYSHSDRSFYPHKTSAAIDYTGKWTSPDTDIGGAADQEKQFDIKAVLADRTALEEFNRYANTAESSGLNRLPEGAKIYRSITVNRKK
jgi:hypothetical protein